MTNHTPAPWRVEPETYQTWLVSTHRQAAAIASGCLHEADARLIAAAPELLATLQAIADSTVEGGSINKAARAAIAKATGEA